jgi:ABC-2 type transport system permease protein
MAEGSLEAMFATPTPPYALILYSSVWPVLYAAAKTALQFGTAGLVFGFTLTRAHWFSAALSLALSAVMFTALGVISASLLVVVKRGDPVNWLFIQMSHLFGGVLFPIEMLPDWGRVLSYAFPIRYALQSTRGALLTGLSPAALAPELLTLLAFDAVAIPFSWLACTVLIDRAKRSGTLSLF